MVAGSFAFASFVRVFRESLGFSASSTPRDSENAVVEHFEGCGAGTERFGRYHEAIMELHELDDDEGLDADASRGGTLGSEGSFSSWEGDGARSDGPGDIRGDGEESDDDDERIALFRGGASYYR